MLGVTAGIFALGAEEPSCVSRERESAYVPGGTDYEVAAPTSVGNDCEENRVTGGEYTMTPTADDVYQLTAESDSASTITLPAIFANGMVFQRGKTINVFGYCDDTDAELKITLGDRVGTASVDENGEWHVELDPINEPTWDLTLVIEQTNTASENMVVFSDIAVGEVWVMSGQSNAQLMVGYLEDVEELAILADSLTNVRAYRAPASYSLTPSKYGSGSWDTAVTSKDVRSTSNSTGLSAVGYAAVARLAVELGPDVPVALIHVARGASKIKTWLDYESLAAISPSEAAKYDECLTNGALPDSAHTKIGTILYNQQIAPYEGFEVAGVMWYQGCGDVSGEALGIEGKSYTEYFTALERVYRRVFGNDGELPFYVMQLAPYTQSSNAGANDLSSFKAEQFDFCRDLESTYLVSNMTDGGVWGDTIFSQGYIHPGRKSTIANRTANLILVNEYEIDLGEAYSHPTPLLATASGNTVTVTFDTELKLFFGDKPVGFELYGGSGWHDATATIDGNKLILTASGVSAPTMVRYGYSPTVAELADGTMIEFLSANAKLNAEAKTITFTIGSETYTVTDAEGYIRTLDYGNVTNASGIPLPIFKMPCE